MMTDRERWNARYRAGKRVLREASPWLVELAEELPSRGRALDVAGGAGRNALWLARRGLDVTLADVSDVALEIARESAEQAGLRLETVRVDFTAEPFPQGPWDVVVCMLYLERAIFAAIARELAPGGLFVFLQPTVKNLERHERPPRAFLLDEGEAARLVVGVGLDLVRYQEGWTSDGHHEARLLARKRREE